MQRIKNLIKQIIYKSLFNYKRSRYNGFLYNLANKYVNYYRGDENGNMETNGEFRLLRELIYSKKIKTVFDVGANIGDYTRKIHELDKDIEIHCFEPDSISFGKLSKRLNIRNIYLNNIALNDSVGIRNLYHNKEHAVLNSFYSQKECGSPNTIRKLVKTTTLDKYCLDNSIKHIGLLKIDVEGGEMNVLQGTRRMLKNSAIDFIQFEFGFAAHAARVYFKDFVDFFKKFGYELYKLKPLKNEKIQYRPELEQTTYSNFLAVKESK